MGFRNNPEDKREYEGITYYVRPNIELGEKSFKRVAVQTHFVERGESYIELASKYALPLYEDGDILSISEKVISMCQNNVVEKKNIKIGFWAKFLSRFASSNNHGIAMDEPYKLQLAINLAGLPRILLACICSAVTKLFGQKGVFYKIAGHGIDGIDGFYMGSSFELYHDLALLNPINPSNVCNEIKNNLGVDCIIVDANDLSIKIFGKSDSLSDISDDELIEYIRDNPAGQSDELTPLIIIKTGCYRHPHEDTTDAFEQSDEVLNENPLCEELIKDAGQNDYEQKESDNSQDTSDNEASGTKQGDIQSSPESLDDNEDIIEQGKCTI